jgi:hypothetical protein
MAGIYTPFKGADDEFNKNIGRRPVVFDIIGPDGKTSLLGDYKLVAYVGPTSLSFSYQKKVSRTMTLGGWIEYYWGDEPYTITLDMTTGTFLRIGSGLSYTTGVAKTTIGEETLGIDLQGSRRETIAYDKYLDLLALFHNNGSIYDERGYVALQGRVQMRFDGGLWYGWFQSFSVSEAAESPFTFKLNAVLQIEREVHPVRTQGGDFK